MDIEMNISFRWCDPDRTILHMQLAGQWEVDVSRWAINEYQRRVRAAAHQVDLVADAIDEPAMRPPAWVLCLGVNGILTAPKNAGLIVLVPNSVMMLALADAGIRLLGARYTSKIRTAATVAEAKQLIHVLRRF